MNEEGFSLLESVCAIFVLSVAIVTTVPVWGMIESQERVAAKMNRASQLAIDEIESAHAGVIHTGSRSVEEGESRYTIYTDSIEEESGHHIRVQVLFQERGKRHEVSYETLVPYN